MKFKEPLKTAAEFFNYPSEANNDEVAHIQRG